MATVTLAMGGFGLAAAVGAEIRFRLGRSQRLKQLQALRVELDQESPDQRVDPDRNRAALLRDAERAFAGVLTRDLARDAQLAELFEDVCRQLAPRPTQPESDST